MSKKIKAEVATDPQVSELVTVRNVPMISTGIDYPVSTGTLTVTAEMLQDVIMSQDDPAVHPPRTKIGHDDPRFNETYQKDGTVLDGEPSLGTWINLRLGDNGQTLIGDLAGCPRWLAGIMATAYPSRSIEGNVNAETVTGHTWRLVISDVALLGVVGPGISTLDDLPLLFSEYGPDITVSEPKEGDPMSVIRSARGRKPAPAADVQAQVNVDDIRRQYYEEIDNTPGTMWWWIRAIYMNPMELIVDDDEGGMYRVGFSLGDDDSVSFANAVPVKVQYVDAPAAAASIALRETLVSAMGRDRIAARYKNHTEARKTQGDSNMTREQIALLRARLNLTPAQLPDDASDAVILSVLAAEEPAPEQTPPINPVPPTPATAEPTKQDDETETETPEQTPPSQIPEGMVLVDAAAWQEVRQQAQSGASVASRLADEERDRFIDEAVKAGKFPPSRKDNYLKLWGTDAVGARALIESLSPGLVPVEARGTTGAAPGSAQDYETGWLTPQEAARINAAKGHGNASREMVIQGGD